MIWNDTAKSVYDAISVASLYKNLALQVMNQAKDYIVMYKPWRDLRVKVQLTLGTDRKITLPADFGHAVLVYSDPGNTGKPQYFFALNDNDISKRYTEEVTTDTNGAFTRKFVFPVGTPLSDNPYLVYSKVIADYTAEDVAGTTKISFFPINLMLVVAKKIFQDYYGVPAHQDPQWVNTRVLEEMRMFEGYAYENNIALDMAVKDSNGNPVFIGGMSLNGGSGINKTPSPYYPSTLFTGGTW